MNPHDSNLYAINTNKNNDLFGGYVRNPCAQQSTSQRQHFLPPYGMPVTNNMSQSLMYNTQNQPIYNIMYTHQSMYRNPNTFTNFPQDSWQGPCKTNNYKEKYETKENCCIESKNFYNYNKNTMLDPQWYYGNYENQKYTDLPSCSQISSDMSSCCSVNDKKSVKYCSIQKHPENDTKLLQYSKEYDNNIYINQYNKLGKEYPSCSQLSQSCSIYSGSACLEIDKKILLDQCEQYYPIQNTTYTEIPKIDKTDENNGNESDIIVENSEEDSDDSEIDKEDILCLLCNVQVHNTSYDISLESTVTSFTHTKVSEKLFQILGWITIENRSKIICSTCMSLLNNLDNLEMQLESLKQKILEKYKTNELCLNKNNIIEEPTTKTVLKRRNMVFKCRKCNKIFSFKKFCIYHLAKHKRKYYMCKYCKKKFKMISLLKKHMRNHKYDNRTNKEKIIPKKNIFICHICGKTFKTSTVLKEHENYCSGNLPFKCKLCEKQFPSNTRLNQHTKLYHEKNYIEICKICNKGFIKISELKIHMLSHSVEKHHKCNICEKIYKTLSNLNQHKKIHRETLPFYCKICQKGFLRKENLALHLNNHNDNKNFGCSICDKKFATQKYLDAHIKIHDGSSKKEICKVCGKQIKHSMKEHLRTHSNVKDFECKDCLMKFLTKGALAKHTKRKHVIKE